MEKKKKSILVISRVFWYVFWVFCDFEWKMSGKDINKKARNMPMFQTWYQ